MENVAEKPKFTARKVEFNDKSLQQREKELAENHASQTTDQTQTDPEPEIPVVVELKDEDVLSFVAKKLNKPVTSFEDLTKEVIKEPELPEDLKTFLKYNQETGRGLEDFTKLNKDYDKVNPDELIAEYLLIKEEGLDKDDVKAIMKKEYEFDEDLDEDDIVASKKLARKKTLNEAKRFFNKQKEDYKIPVVSAGPSLSDEDKTEFAEFKSYKTKLTELEKEDNRKAQVFNEKTNDLFSTEFKGFEFPIKDAENKVVKTLVFAPGDAAQLKKAQATPRNFINKFLDENGAMKDAAGYHRGLAVAMNPESFAKFFYEQGLSDAKEKVIAGMKNINMDERKAPQIASKGLTVKVLKGNEPQGNGLKIQSAKRV